MTSSIQHRIPPRWRLYSIAVKVEYCTKRAISAPSTEESSRWWKAKSKLYIAYNKLCDQLNI